MIVVLIAAYNEEDALPAVLAALPRRVAGHRVRTVVLSDGSTDATVERARDSGAEVVEMVTNRGKGSALKRGLGSLVPDDASAIVLMDADGQHDPGSFVSIVTPVLEGEADVVVGSRYLNETGRGSTPVNRYLVRSAVMTILHWVLSAGVTDPFSGYRALSPRAAGCMQLHGDRYESELEMLFCAEANSLRVLEVPTPRIYGSRTSRMGARHGDFIGRIDVVSQYARTLATETHRLHGRGRSSVREAVRQ